MILPPIVEFLFGVNILTNRFSEVSNNKTLDNSPALNACIHKIQLHKPDIMDCSWILFNTTVCAYLFVALKISCADRHAAIIIKKIGVDFFYRLRDT